jgi:hypothetical protein
MPPISKLEAHHKGRVPGGAQRSHCLLREVYGAGSGVPHLQQTFPATFLINSSSTSNFRQMSFIIALYSV